MRSSIGRCELWALSKDIGEPGAEIFDSAAVRVPPDLGQIVAARIILLMLHAQLRVSEKRHLAPCKLREPTLGQRQSIVNLAAR
jgi:hypothetical protein